MRKSGNVNTNVGQTFSPDYQGRQQEGVEELSAGHLPTDKAESSQQERPQTKPSGEGHREPSSSEKMRT